MNPSDVKRLVKNATSQKDRLSMRVDEGALEQIALESRSFVSFPIIMNVLWKRINADGKDWRHIEKGLVLLEYLLRRGSEQCVCEAQVRMPEIKTLTDFRCHEKGSECGQGVRDWAHKVMALLGDDANLNSVRAAEGMA